MAVMIKLRLSPQKATLAAVQELPGLKGLVLDPRFGVVCLNPNESLYAVRTDVMNDLEERRTLSPEVLEAYGDIRISTT